MSDQTLNFDKELRHLVVKYLPFCNGYELMGVIEIVKAEIMHHGYDNFRRPEKKEAEE